MDPPTGLIIAELATPSIEQTDTEQAERRAGRHPVGMRELGFSGFTVLDPGILAGAVISPSITRAHARDPGA
jgi:hypothetical protein